MNHLNREQAGQSHNVSFSFSTCLCLRRHTLSHSHLHRYYFSVAGHPGEQFFTFSCLSAWLIKRRSGLEIGSRDLKPQEFEDPNVTISTILDVMRDASTERIDFPASKLKQGWGIEVIRLLTQLVDLSLRRRSQRTSSGAGSVAAITLKGLQSSSVVDADATADAVSEENDAEISVDEHFNLMDEDEEEASDSPASGAREAAAHDDLSAVTVATSALDADVDVSAWMQEVDRVLPKLRVTIRAADVKSDWRLRVAQLDSSQGELEKKLEMTKGALDRLTRETGGNVERIRQREKHLQSQFEPLINEYISLKGQLNDLTGKYGVVSKGVTEKSQILSEISEELESMKTEMEERSSSMTDGTPLVSLRKALQRIRSEVSSIDIRIGVATHTILQANLKDSMLQLVTRKGAAGADGQDAAASLIHDPLF